MKPNTPEQKHARLIRKLERLQDHDLYKEAFAVALQILAMFPTDDFALQVAFRHYLSNSEYAEARALLIKVHGPDREKMQTRLLWLSLLWEEGNREEAFELALAIGLKKRSDLATIRAILQILNQAAFDDVRRLLERVFADDPNSIEHNQLQAEAAFQRRIYREAYALAQRALEAAPDRPELQALVADYRLNYRDAEAGIGFSRIVGLEPGDARENYQRLLELEPDHTKWQERYGLAEVLWKWPVFRIFFHRFNPYSYGFWPIWPMWHFVALLPFIYHFKKTDEALDPVWDRALLVVAILFIARFTVFPLAVQFSARRRSPTYHLLKKPRLFFYGCLYLAIWKAIAFFPSQPKSYYLLLFACLPINTAIIEWSRFSRNPNFRRLAYVFGAAVLLISALSMAELLPALFDFFVFCGWGPFILVYAVLERAEKSKVGFMKPLYPDFPPA